jgi:hypothetical protein
MHVRMRMCFAENEKYNVGGGMRMIEHEMIAILNVLISSIDKECNIVFSIMHTSTCSYLDPVWFYWK